MNLNISFEDSPTVSAYMQANDRHRLIVGPFGSGKSVGSQVEIPRRATMQAQAFVDGKHGDRKSRWAVVRNTQPQLRDTTMKTWFDWFPNGSIGYYLSTTKTYHIKKDGLDAEVCFRALDDAKDVSNLLSLELTGGYLNEFRDIQKEIFQALDGRINRYPRQIEGGASWVGIWGDSNMPEEGSYWYAIMEGRDPENPKDRKPNAIRVFRQPPAMLKMPDGSYVLNPRAENLKYLPQGYYPQLVKDKTDDFIRVNVLVEYGRSAGGRPAHPMFSRVLHVAHGPITPNIQLVLVIGADFGMTPAMVLKQQDAFGRVLTLDEVARFDMGLERAVETYLWPLLERKYRGYELFFTGDPSGDTRADGDETTCADIFRVYKKRWEKRGWRAHVRLADTNSPVARRGATDHFLTNKIRPAYLMDPSCEMSIEAMSGKFMYKRTKDGRHSEEIDKNDHSHIGEANEYGDRYFEKGGRRKAEHREEDWDSLMKAQSGVSSNIYVSPR